MGMMYRYSARTHTNFGTGDGPGRRGIKSHTRVGPRAANEMRDPLQRNSNRTCTSLGTLKDLVSENIRWAEWTTRHRGSRHGGSTR